MNEKIMDIKIKAAYEGYKFDVSIADNDNGCGITYGFGIYPNHVLTEQTDEWGQVVDDGIVPWLEAIKKIEECCQDPELYDVVVIDRENQAIYA